MKCPICSADKLETEIGGLNEVFKCKKCNYSGELAFENNEGEESTEII